MRETWAWGLAALLLAIGLAVVLQPLDPGVLKLQLAFTPRAFGEVVHAWPAEHLARYRAQLWVDFLLLGCYGRFGYLLATRWPVMRSIRSVAWWLPLAATFDAAENAWHLWLTEVPRFGVAWMYAAAGSCAALKWTLLLTFAGAVAWALVRGDGPGSRKGPRRSSGHPAEDR